MKLKHKIVKLNIELVLMYPIVLLGRLYGIFNPLKIQPDIFLFSPSADIGGSLKVNAEILGCIKNKKALVIFSKKPKNNKFIQLYSKAHISKIDLSKYIDNKLYHFVNFFYRGVIASWINKTPNPVIIGGEAIFFYKILPHVKSSTKCIDLCHLNTWFNYSIVFLKYLDQRIFSTPQIKRDVEVIYASNKIEPKYYERLNFIDNKIDIPNTTEVIKNESLRVLFVGRGAPQKRVYLIAEIAKRLHIQNHHFQFSFVGDVDELIPEDVKFFCKLYGQISDTKTLNDIYNKNDILILTSAYEGLPIVVMEMMARGKIIVSTAVGGIPDYISDNENGLLITNIDEEEIVTESVHKLQQLAKNDALRNLLSQNAYTFALNRFGEESFCKAYNKILEY